MGGSDPRTLILVGRTGNGKSATGNSILRNKTFESKRSACGVTSTSELKTTVLENGQRLNVIDTPGLFDSSIDKETIGKEIVSCIKMAADGIHAVLLVFSVTNRFSDEEKAAISILQGLFGRKICDYMIVVFTGGDELEEDEKTLGDFLSECPQALKDVLGLCGNRCVLFDNRTKDETKKANQVQRLLAHVNTVLVKNGGEPYTNDIFTEFKKWAEECEENSKEEQKLHAERLKHFSEKIQLEFENLKLKFERDLLEEQTARMKLERDAEAAIKKGVGDVDRLREELKEASRGRRRKRSNLRMVVVLFYDSSLMNIL